jgi:serine/threonine protein kinase
MGDAAQAQEAEALDKIRQLLPDDGIARAWANVTFTDNQGRLNEVDVLLLTRTGLFIVELKGWHGEITGDQRAWRLGNRSEKNPRLLANDKAKRLRSVLTDLARTASLPSNVIPYIDEAVVMHGRKSRIRLDRFGAESVWALNGFEVQGLPPDRAFSVLLAKPPTREAIDLPRARQIDALMDAAGLMPRPRQRMIGQYALDSGEPLGEGPGWQEFLVTHPRARTKHRIRLFPYPKGASRDVRHAIDTRAEREFRLTFGIAHPGIVGPSEFLTPEEGPALVFAYDPDEVSLDEYLTVHADELIFEDRERMVQELAELVRFAHGQRLTHRALSPLSVRVKASSGGSASLQIRDWDLARRPDGDTTSATEISRGLTDIRGSVEFDAFMYLAPETLRQATPASAQTLDVYGVGAVAIRILTGKPPALNVAALEALVNSDATGLDPRAQMPEISDEYAVAILSATSFDEQHRTIDISEFQRDIEDARRRARAPEPEPSQGDPLDAAVGDIVDARFEILARRGSGSTGVALEVTDYQLDYEQVILKLAKDDAAAARLAVEAQVLDRLDHPRIVKRLDGPLSVGTRQGLLLSDAGLETVADRIRMEGRATIEQLERYGADLFDLVAHLDERGVFHRDIKPSNLAVKPDPGSRKPRLTLFDFSLAEEPLTHIKSGSRPYLDPYLGNGGRSQYDSAAERFAITATLFELATADPIWWEQGDMPASPSDAPVVQASMFDPAVADGLTGFFRAALAPKAEDRHASLDAMRAAWAEALSGAAIEAEDVEANDAKAQAATVSTVLADSGLSARALSALTRLRVGTVGELLGVPPMSINQIRGLGEQVRREISTRVREWRHRLASPTTIQTEAPTPTGRRSVESYLGTTEKRLNESPEDRFKRVRKNGTLSGLTQDAARWLRELDNVATLDELARKLLREYGSTLAEDRRMDAATAVVRTVLELDMRSRDPLFVLQTVRDRSRTVIAYAPDDDGGLTFDEAELHLDTLVRLGGVVDSLLEQSDVVPTARLREALLDDTPQLRVSDGRLTQLAVALSTQGRLSSMGEVYRSALDPQRAVELALRGAATRELAVVTIEQRVRARFPEVEAIPNRPALDGHVRAAMPYLEWQEELGKYAVRAIDESSLAYTASSTTFGSSAADPAIAARLKGSIRDHSALVIVASRRQSITVTANRLAREYGLRVVDLAGVALTALKSMAEARNVQWSVVIAADAEPEGSPGRRNLEKLAHAALTPVWEELLASTEPTIFVNPAVLARLGLDGLITTVLNLATPRAAARWFLLPRPMSGRAPDLDGYPMPFGADGWLELSLEGLPVIDQSTLTTVTTAAATTTLKGLTK